MIVFPRRPWLTLLPLMAALLLASCGTVRTYADVQATAQATGCWPDPFPTPRAVTVTPAGALAATPPLPVPPETPAATALPTTTPYPRCPPAPGATLIPWPTPVPNPPPYPTMEPRRWQGGSDVQTTLHLPNTVLATDLAAHPTDGWPAVASVVWSGTRDPERVLVSVYQPHAGLWIPARQVDVGESHLGRYVRTAQVAITGDGGVHVVWGMSDPDFRDGDPPVGVWASQSADGGESWSAPRRLTTTCRRVNDVAASTDGWVAVLLICEDGSRASRPAVVVRQPDGAWRAAEPLPFGSWYYSEGAITIVGEGQDARAVGVVLTGRGGAPLANVVSKRLADGGSWQVETLPAAPPMARPDGERMWHPQALAYDRPDGRTAITFTWTEADAATAYALTSLDGGQTWGQAEVVAQASAPETIVAVAPAYDPAADRLAAVWTCCGYDQWSVQGTTHYASWSAPGSGEWRPAGREDTAGPRVPLVLGARSAFETVSAQAAGSRMTWVAWIEQQRQVVVRSLPLNQIIPAGEYPPSTPLPTPGGTR